MLGYSAVGPGQQAKKSTGTPLRPNSLALSKVLYTLQDVWKRRSLIFMLAGRDINAKYRSSLLGLIWALIVPLSLLGIYTFVFTVLFVPRTGDNLSRVDFALSLFCGLTVYNIFAEAVGKAPSLILSYKNLVKKQQFPVHILPWVVTTSTIVNSTFSFGILTISTIILRREVSLDILLLPFVLTPYVMLLTGAIYILSAAGVYVRDIGQGIPLFLRVTMFVTPVFYPLSLIPERFQIYMMMNPVAFFVHETRKVFLSQDLFNWFGFVCYFIIALSILSLGIFTFNKLRPGFADVL